MIDAGQLKIVLRNGRMVFQLSNDVLFDSGQTEIKPGGQQALAQIATVLATIDNGLVLLGIPEFWRMFIQGAAIVLAATADVTIAGQVRNTLRVRRRIARTSP